MLIKTKAISINSWDYDLVRGKPRIYRLMFGIGKPKYPVIGIDVAGTVVATGSDVKNIKAGDEVFGDLSSTGFGTYAEYVCTRENLLTLKPEDMPFDHAAALPHVGLLALQGLKRFGKVKAGDEVLLNGAGGGVGTLSLQLCKHWGATVTCVDKGSKLNKLLALDADHVVDYTKTDFTDTGKKYDLILDPVAHRPISHYSRALKNDGRFVMIGGSVSVMLSSISKGMWINWRTKKKMGLLPYKPNAEDLNLLADYWKRAILKPVIGSTFDFEGIPAAVAKLGEGDVFGKAVVTF